jgi:hypothetical protein
VKIADDSRVNFTEIQIRESCGSHCCSLKVRGLHNGSSIFTPIRKILGDRPYCKAPFEKRTDKMLRRLVSRSFLRRSRFISSVNALSVDQSNGVTSDLPLEHGEMIQGHDGVKEMERELEGAISGRSWKVVLFILNSSGCGWGHFGPAFSAALDDKNLKVSMELLLLMQFNSIEPSVETTMRLVQLNCDYGLYSEAVSVIDQWKQIREINGISLNENYVGLPLYNIIYTNMMNDIKGQRVVPGVGGFDYNLAFTMLQEMLVDGIGATEAVWHKALYIVGKGGDWRRVHNIISNMKAYHISPTPMTYAMGLSTLGKVISPIDGGAPAGEDNHSPAVEVPTEMIERATLSIDLLKKMEDITVPSLKEYKHVLKLCV